jgi:CAAX prenyl protease-like protein
MTRESQARKAFIAPFVAFMLLLGISQGLQSIFGGGRLFLLVSPQYWIYPLQTLVCGAILIRFWPLYQFSRPAKPVFTVLIALLVLVIWVAPQEFLGAAPRLDGFNPEVFKENPAFYSATLIFRFLRLVVAVPLLEEIFWRGFLLRDLISQDFTKVPLGTFSPLSFLVVTLLFGLAHFGPDFWPAILTGALYNLVAYRTRSLSACVLAHAVTNLVLGLYIMKTKQWGFW